MTMEISLQSVLPMILPQLDSPRSKSWRTSESLKNRNELLPDAGHDHDE